MLFITTKCIEKFTPAAILVTLKSVKIRNLNKRELINPEY